MDHNRRKPNAMMLTLGLVAALLLGGYPHVALGQFDFYGGDWQAAHGEESCTVGCVTVDVDPEGLYNDHLLYWDSTDGLGVTTPDPGWDPPLEPDEIDATEEFQIRFCRPTYIAGISVADLYPEFLSPGTTNPEWYDWGGSGDGSGEAEGEIGWVVPDASWEDAAYFYGEDSLESNGQQYVPLGLVVTTLDFYTICSNSDYSVLGVDPWFPIQIDIKPGSYPNSINLGSKGVVPVAILTTADFDATTVDPVTVRFASVAPIRWAVEDVDGDSDDDLILHFDVQALDLTVQSIAASLTGRTLDGVYLIKGTDTVKILGNKDVKCLPPGPGTGTPGYWMNHPEAWPTDCVLGYDKEEAIALMELSVKGDKTLTLFPALVAAILNVEIGNDASCICCTIDAAVCWLDANPVGSGVKANSDAWQDCGEWLYRKLDAYNNGWLCAPSRDSLE